jgi:hypothetical protein
MAKLISLQEESIILLNKCKAKVLKETNYEKYLSNDKVINLALKQYLGEQ